MARSYGFVAKIGADTTGLEASLRNIDNASRTLNTELNQINRALRLDPRNVTLTAQRLEVMGQQAEQARERIRLLEEQQEEMNRALADGRITGADYREYERAIESARRTIENFNRAQRNNRNNTDEVTRSTSDWKDVLKGIVTSQILQEITSLLREFAASAVEVGKSFDTAMSQVAATMGILQNDVDFAKLSASAQQMGATTKYSATEAAEALNYLALAGYDADKAIAALPTVLNVAQAGATDLAYASDMITDSMSALGLTVEDLGKFSDQLARTSQKSNTNVAQLGEAILTVGGTAKNLKGGITELNTMLGLLADNGIKGAEGGTALRNIIVSLSPSTGKAAKAMQDLNVAVYDSQGNMRALSDVFADFNKAFEPLTTQERTQALSTIFKDTDLKSVNALLGTSAERFKELSEYVEESSGAAQQMADTMNDNLEGALAQVNSAMEAFQYGLYAKVSEPAKEATKSFAGLITAMTGNTDPQAMQDAVDSLSYYIRTVLDNLANSITDDSAELMPALLESINSSLRAVSDSGADVILAFVKGIIDNLPHIAEGAIQIVVGLADGLADALPELTPAIVNTVAKLVEVILENLPMVVEASVGIIRALTEGLISSVPLLLQEVPAIIEQLVAAIIGITPELMVEVPIVMGQAIIDGLVNYDWEEGARRAVAALDDAMKRTAANMAANEGYEIAGSITDAELRLAEAKAELAAKQAAENGGIIADGMSEGAEKVKAAGGELEEAVADSLEGVNAAADNGIDGLTTRAGLLSDALEELEHQYKTHNKTELEYQTERKALLERYADVSDEEWWEMYDDACEYFDNMREAEAEALQKEQEALKKAAEERQKAYDKQHEADVKAAEGRFDNLIDELTEGEVTREEFNLRYIALTEELAERQIDISAYAADKIAEYDEKIREENYKAWEKSAEEVTKAISSAYDDVTRSYEQARDKYISSASLIDEKITDTSGAERYILSDFKAQTKALREYQEDLKKLKETGISDELLEQVMGLSYDSGERQGYIDELLKMSDEQRKKYYRDIDAYLAAAEGAAEAEVSDKLSDADRLAREGIEKIYGSLPADAYDKGVATARSFIDGINSEMAAADELRLSAADVQSREAFTAARSELQSGANNQRGGNYYEGSTPINIYIDGKAAIKSTLDSLLRKNKLTGGNNLHV